MKAIIIAAGRGKRMKELTEDVPKCLLKINGRKLLDYLLDTLRDSGIHDISIVVGYKREKIQYPELKYYVNQEYEHNNILLSLMYAEDEMNDELIAVYSDILYEKLAIKSLMKSKADIAIAVDVDWRTYYEGRTEHPIEEAENVVFDKERKVTHIGKILPDKNAAHGEFMGMVKCSRKGTQVFTEHFERLKKIYPGKPFQTANVFENAYLTDMIQELVDSGVPVECVLLKGGWKEIDTVADYERLAKQPTITP